MSTFVSDRVPPLATTMPPHEAPVSLACDVVPAEAVRVPSTVILAPAGTLMVAADAMVIVSLAAMVTLPGSVCPSVHVAFPLVIIPPLLLVCRLRSRCSSPVPPPLELPPPELLALPLPLLVPPPLPFPAPSVREP